MNQGTSYKPLLPAPAIYTIAGVAAACVVGALVAGNEDLAVGLTAFFVLALTPLRWPLEGVYLVLLTGWLPLEDLFGSERSLFASVGGLNVSGMRLLGGLVGLGLALFALRGRLRRIALPPWMGLGIVAYCAWVAWSAVTLLWTPDFVDGTRGVAKLAFPLLVAGVLAADPRALGPRRLTDRTVKVLGASLLLATLYGFAGLADRSLLPTVESGWVPEWFGWAGWSIFGFIAAIVGIVWLALSDHRTAPPVGRTPLQAKLFAAGLIALAFVQIPLALKRITVGAAGVGVSLMYLVSGRTRLLAPIGVIVAGATLLFFPPLVERNVYEGNATPDQPTIEKRGAGGRSIGALGDIANRPQDVENVIRLEGREDLWRSAIESMGGADFAIGTGINGWNSANENVSGGGQLHGEPVRILYEMGAVGLLLVGLAFGALFASFVRVAIRSPENTRIRALGGAAAAVLVMYLLTTLTDNTFDYYLVGAYAWTVFALVAVSWREPIDEPTTDSAEPARQPEPVTA